MTTTCPACMDREKGSDRYLCYECWHELRLRARRALRRQDDRSLIRYRELSRQIAQGLPLSQIEVTA